MSYLVPYHIISYCVIQHITSHHIKSYHIVLYPIISCYILYYVVLYVCIYIHVCIYTHMYIVLYIYSMCGCMYTAPSNDSVSPVPPPSWHLSREAGVPAQQNLKYFAAKWELRTRNNGVSRVLFPSIIEVEEMSFRKPLCFRCFSSIKQDWFKGNVQRESMVCPIHSCCFR